MSTTELTKRALDEATANLDPPLAVVDLDAFDANADALTRRAGHRSIRVASKSIRCINLLRRTLAKPGFHGVLSYSLREALRLFAEGVSDDLVVAYPTVDRSALRELERDDNARAAITIMVDSVEQLSFMDSVRNTESPLRVCMEVDASWRPLGPLPRPHVGTLRSPVHTPAQAAALAAKIAHGRGYQLVGVMLYEGQIAGIPDAAGGWLNRGALRWMRRLSIAELAQRRAEVVRKVSEVTALEFVNGGGTGSLEMTATEDAVTELAAGSGLMGPSLFDGYRAFQPLPAAVFALPVLRRPRRRAVTLFGGGYLASGVPRSDRLPSVFLPRGLRYTRTEGAGEVQTPVIGRSARGLRVGDRVWFRHAKAGELAERFPEYVLLRRNRVVEIAPTYRGDGVTFG